MDQNSTPSVTPVAPAGVPSYIPPAGTPAPTSAASASPAMPATPAPTVAPAVHTPMASAPSPTPSMSPTPEQPTMKDDGAKRKRMMMLAAVGILVVLIGAGVLYVLSMQSSSNVTVPTPRPQAPSGAPGDFNPGTSTTTPSTLGGSVTGTGSAEPDPLLEAPAVPEGQDTESETMAPPTSSSSDQFQNAPLPFAP